MKGKKSFSHKNLSLNSVNELNYFYQLPKLPSKTPSAVNKSTTNLSVPVKNLATIQPPQSPTIQVVEKKPVLKKFDIGITSRNSRTKLGRGSLSALDTSKFVGKTVGNTMLVEDRLNKHLKQALNNGFNPISNTFERNLSRRYI